MAENRDLTVALGSDTSGFSEGIKQAKNILTELNKTLLNNQSTLKAATQELNTYEKEQRNLQTEMSKTGGDTEENRMKMEKLNAQIQEQREKVAQLKTEQTDLRGQISRATTALKNQTEEAQKQIRTAEQSVSAADKLKNTVAEQQAQLESLKQEYSNIVLEQGKNSEKAAELAVSIGSLSEKMQENAEKLKNAAYSAEDYAAAMGEVPDPSEEVKSKSDELKDTISGQEEELEALKEQYTDIVLEQGKTSEQAQSLAERISELSSGLDENRQRLEEAAYNASDYNETLGETTEVSEEQEEANENLREGFTVLKGAVSDLAADALQAAVDKFRELMTSGNQALNSIQAQTGMTNAEMSDFKEQMYDLYSENYGESLEDVANVIATVNENIDESDPEKIKEISKNAIAMSDTFGSDVEETLQGVNGLMTNMGLTAEQAFDYIAKGSQNGLDKTHELSDNLAEYTQIWGQAGFSAQEMFTILQNGLDSGAYNLDKVNDFVKEFAISLADGRIEENIGSFSTETENLFKAWKSGKATQADVFQSVINDLSNMTNQQKALTLASNVWSSLGEDNALTVIQSLNNVNDAYSDVEGTMQSINDVKYDDIENQIAAIGRQFEVDIIQPIVEGATPQIKEIINWVSEHLPEVTGTVTALTTATLGYKAAVNMTTILSTIKNSFAGLTAAKVADTAATEAATVAQIGLNTAMNANPVILLITAVATLVIGLGTYMMAAGNATESTEKYTRAVEEAKKAAESIVEQSHVEAEEIQALGEIYDELRLSTDETAEKQQTLNIVAEKLASRLGTTTDAIKDQSGAYIDLSSQIDNTIKQMEKEAVLEANQSVLKEAYTQRYNAEKALNDKKLELEKYYEEHKDAIDKFSTGESYGYGVAETYEYNQLKNEVDALQESYDECDKTVEEYTKQLKEDMLALDENTESTDNNTTSKYKSAKLTSSSSSSIEQNTTATSKNADAKKLLTLTEEELEQITKNAADAFNDMATTEETLQSVTDEVAENQTLSLGTLNNLVKKYPELAKVVNEYINGVKTGQDVINELTEVYKNDVENYNKAVLAKAETDTEFYNQLVQNSADIVNEYKDKYGIDLQNFKNAEQAKAAVVAAAEEQKRQEIAKTTKTTAQTYINSGSSELARIGREMKKSIDNGTYNDYAVQQAGQEAARKFDEAVTNSSYYTEFYGGSYTPKNVTVSAKTLDKINKSNSSSSDDETETEKALKQLDRDKNLGKVSTRQEINRLNRIKQAYEQTADEEYDIEYRLYQAKQKLQEEEEDSRQEQLDLAYAAYEKLVNNKIKLIEQETEAAEKAANKQISAIDEMIEARKRLNEDKDRQKELDEINARLQYEQLNELNRRELERKKQDLLDEQAEVDWQRQMSDKKENIRNGLSASQEKNEQAMEALQAAAESAKNYFDKLSGSQSSTQIVTNNSDTRNIQIIQNALNDQQMVDKLLNAIYSK